MGRAGSGLLVLAATFGVAFGPSTALTAEPDPSDVAREHFQRGVEHARAESWALALEAFTKAYALAPTPNVLLNLAGALVKTGRFCEGAAAYRRFLAEAPSEVLASLGQAASSALREASKQIAYVSLVVPHRGADDTLWLDGAPVAVLDVGQELPVDPGPHALLLLRRGVKIAREAIRLAAGEHRKVLLDGPADLVLTGTVAMVSRDAALAASAAPARLPPRPHAPNDDLVTNSLLSSAWLWIAVAGLAAGGVVTAAVLLNPSAPPFEGTISPGSVRIP